MYVDLHSDTITVLNRNHGQLAQNNLMISLEKGAALKNWAQTYAVFIPDTLRGKEAAEFYDDNLGFFQKQMEKNSGMVSQPKFFDNIAETWARGEAVAILAVEGGGSLLAWDLDQVEKMSDAGVKYLSLTWNGKNELASGNETQEGLSELGRGAVAELERWDITLDVSHLNDKGFDDLVHTAKKPFIATHSNLRSVCGHKRNLTDDQFKEIVKRDGLVGINFCKAFLNDDKEKAGFPDLIRHIERMLSLGGENVIAIGSDFDGTTVPDGMGSVENLADVENYLLCAGLGKKQVEKIMGGNAYEFLRRRWG